MTMLSHSAVHSLYMTVMDDVPNTVCPVLSVSPTYECGHVLPSWHLAIYYLYQTTLYKHISIIYHENYSNAYDTNEVNNACQQNIIIFYLLYQHLCTQKLQYVLILPLLQVFPHSAVTIL